MLRLITTYLVVFILIFFDMSNAIAQKGEWQKRLEKRLQSSQTAEQALIIRCQIAQEKKEYDLPSATQEAQKYLVQAQQKQMPLAEAYAYYALAECYKLTGRSPIALTHFSKALHIFRQHNKKVELMIVKRDSVLAYINQSRFSAIQEILLQALTFFEQHTPRQRQHALSLFYLGINYLRLAQYEKAVEATQEAQRVFKEIGDNLYYARCFNNLGLMYKNKGLYAKAVPAYRNALALYQKMGEKQRAASIVLGNLGNLYHSLKDTIYQKDAQEYHKKAFQIAIEIKDTLQITHCLELLAKAEANLGHFAKAKQYYEQGIAIMQKTDNWLEQGYYTLRACEIYLSSKEPQKAIEYAQNMVALFRKNASREVIAQAEAKLSVIYSLMNKGQESQQYAYSALQNASPHDSSSVAFLYPLMTNNALQLKNYKEAEYWAFYSLAYFQKVGGKAAILSTYKNLIQLDTIQKNYARANHWWQRYYQLKDSLLQVDKTLDILEMQFRYNLNEQKKENDYLKKLNQLQAEAYNQQQIVLLFVIFILTTTTIAFILLYRNRQRLKLLLQTVQQQNKEITDKNAEIESQKATLEKLNSTKDRILSVVSHDMRNPLANLRTVLEMATNGFISLEEQHSLFTRLNKDVDRTYTFLEQLLLWAESQNKGFTPLIEPIDAQQLVQNIINITENQATNKNIKVHNLIAKKTYIHSDNDIIHIVLLNLVTNAIKFSHMGGNVTITLQNEHSDKDIFIVKDEGIGIAPENEHKIFGQERFTTKGTQQEKGTGFGLSLCLDFIKSIGGNMYFITKQEKGTSFFVEIPKKQ